MMRRPFAVVTTVVLAALSQPAAVTAQGWPSSAEFSDDRDRFSESQLDNLVGAVALYPDALLAQVLIAATFPDQLDDAARYVRTSGVRGVDEQPWDVSVKSVAHYSSALALLADRSDWAATLGRAYVTQPDDVMASIQRMRARADRQGNLRSTPQQFISNDGGNYIIAPAQSHVLFVPTYDPYVVYSRPIFGSAFGNGFGSSSWSFGSGFPIGSWLSYDCNWRTRRVYYNGWDASYYGQGGGWRGRSRPFIEINNVYVNPRYRSVYWDRGILRRRIVYRDFDRYGDGQRDRRNDGRSDRGGADRRDRDRNDRYRDNGGRWGHDSRDDDRGGWGRNSRDDDRGRWGRGSRDDDRRQSNAPERARDDRRAGLPSSGDNDRRNRDVRRADAPLINPRRIERTDQVVDSPLINPRRAERAEQVPVSGSDARGNDRGDNDRGNNDRGGNGRGSNRGADRNSRERPPF